MGESVGDQLSDMVIGERVVDVFAIAPRDNDPLGSQQLEPLRNRRQVILQPLGQFRDTHLALRQQGQQAQTTLIPKSSENGGRSEAGIRIGDQKEGCIPAMIFTEAICISRWYHAPHPQLPNSTIQPIN